MTEAAKRAKKSRLRKKLRELNAQWDDMRDQIEATERELSAINDCPICGEPEYMPCFVEVHEEHAAMEALRKAGGKEPWQ